MKVLIVYDSSSGNTEKMASLVAEGVSSEGVDVVIKKVDNASVDELLSYHGIILGSPVYYGLPSSKIKKFLDDSAKFHGKLEGKIGGAFVSSGGTHTGAETTLIALLEALLIHGMVIQGASSWNHYGSASVGAPDNEKTRETCRKE
ncbi:flavodoxin family protein, partial [Candidatus Bathyarchaeota archaeon]|nr:flavodoxin family protein [Candidatus Bathyarchaeota archaeon]